MFRSKRLEFLTVFVATFMILGLLSTVASSKEVSGPRDDFNDNIIDLAKWYVPDFDPQYSSVMEVNQQLEMSLTRENVGDYFGINVWSTWQFEGDFDVQVDYRLLLWPPENEIRVGLIGGGNNVERSGRAEPLLDFHLTNFGDGVQGQVETDVEEASLRLIREGSQVSGYYSDETTGGDWILIHTGPSQTTGLCTVALSIWGHVSTPDVLVAFDNFIVNAGEIYTPVDQMIDLIKDAGLNQGIERSLVAKLKNGQEAFMKGQRNAGINILQAFINEIEAQRGKGIPEPLANMLISTAEQIILRISSVPSAAPARQNGVSPQRKLTAKWSEFKSR